MNEKEYMELLDSIRRRIRQGNTEQTGKELDALFQVKPVRLKWFIAKAEWMFEKRCREQEVLELLEGKFSIVPNSSDVEDVLRIYRKAYRSMGEKLPENQMLYFTWKLQCLSTAKMCMPHQNFEKRFREHRAVFLEKPTEKKHVRLLMEDYYTRGDWVLYLLLSYLLEQLDDGYRPRIDLEAQYANSGYLRKRLAEEDATEYIVVGDENQDAGDCEALINALLLLGKQVHFIDKPLPFKLENKIELSDTLAISLENLEHFDGLTIYHSVEIYAEGESIGDNRDFLMKHITGTADGPDMMVSFCVSRLFGELSMRPPLKRQMERLSEAEPEILSDCTAFGWCGNYLTYISQIYGFDVKECLSRQPEYSFSIVVPVRNSAATLRYTLQSCLNQRYAGSYEIVLSDNSTDGNTDIYQLYLELNDSRIHYYKTPGDLQLGKAFEYAFLQAKGEFILSIGADDAVLPWTLEALDKVLERHPSEEIVQWDRGFYAWPGFNKGQQNQFVIPGQYIKGEIMADYVEGREYTNLVLNKSEYMYSIPTLYINSGFKHAYMKTMLERAGSLWDAPFQDIYMGVVNILINNRILHINYPLSIAGMSNGSIGARSSAGAKSESDIKNQCKGTKRDAYAGGCVKSDLEYCVPDVENDAAALYQSFLRAEKKGLCPISISKNEFYLKRAFIELCRRMTELELLYDFKMSLLRTTASKHGKLFLDWFKEEIYDAAMMPGIIDTEKMAQQENRKLYEEGMENNGREVLDASRYGVANIMDAVLLFEKRTGL